MQEQDYIERMIQQIAAAIAAVLGAVSAGRLGEAEHDLDRAWSVLGLRRVDIVRLSDDTARVLLGAKTELAAGLLDAQASIEEARGAAADASTLRARAARLRAAGSTPA